MISSLSDVSRRGLLFLGLVAFVFLLSVGLTVWRIVTLVPLDTQLDQNVIDFIFAVVLLVNLLFFAFHAVNGVVHELPEALLAFAFAAVLISFYELYRFISKCVAIESFFGLEATDYVRFFSIIILAPLSLVFAYLTYVDFGWHDYKIVGADPIKQGMYRDYHRFVNVLIIDLQLGVSLATFSAVSFFATPESSLFDTFDLVSFIVYVAVSVLWMWLGYRAVRTESKWMMIVFYVLALVEPTYIVYSFWKFLSDDFYDAFDALVRPLLALGVVAFIVRLAVLGLAARCHMNFYKGLRPVFERNRSHNDVEPRDYESEPFKQVSVNYTVPHDPTAIV